MGRKEDKNFSNKSFNYMVIGVAIMILTALITSVVFWKFIGTIRSVENSDDFTYEQHYVFVGEDVDNEFWNQVYVSAKEQAGRDNIYLENMKESLNVNYSAEDLLRVATNSAVDGIIYVGNSSNDVAGLIDEAVQKGIGVCVLHNDVDQSQRQCYVGVNNYELGQMYAQEILDMTSKEELDSKNIALLAGGSMPEGAVNLIILAIEDTFREILPEDSLPEIEVIKIVAEDTFSVEEDIRSIFLTRDTLPDIMLCLESTYTQCVYQALVDYNHVGEVNVIGYFASDDILEAIDKQIIYSTVSVDTAEMGQSSILALEEYNEMGYTNSFMPVSMEIIDQESAAAKISEKEETGDTQ